MTPEREAEIRKLVTEWPTYGDEGHDAVVDLLAEVERLRAAPARMALRQAETRELAACAELDEANAKVVKAVAALRLLNQTLTIPAAEYVPAIGDCFVIIDQTLKEISG